MSPDEFRLRSLELIASYPDHKKTYTDGRYEKPATGKLEGSKNKMSGSLVALQIREFEYRIFIKRPSAQDPSWSTYMDVFHPTLWAVLLVTILLSGGAVGGMYWLERRTRLATLHQGNFGWGDSLMYCFAAVCQQGADREPSGLGTRFYFWTFYVVTVTIVASYSAMLVSSLAVVKLELPFETMEGLMKAGTHKLMVPAGSSMLDYFKFSPLETLQRVYRDHILEVESGAEGKRRIQTETAASFGVYNGQKECDVVDIKRDYYVRQAAIGLQKNSPYEAFFNYRLARMRETGVMEHLQRTWLNGVRPDCGLQQAPGLGLPVMASAFLLLAAGVVCSLMLLGAECLHARLLQHPVRPGPAGDVLQTERASSCNVLRALL
ncbi:glutamate receptor ionotropic, kainate 4-like [Pollicipes pollicipes]|uniref:glutamate receptor ionotropic, kainate 4-like n=1 Tax=Pollicipes pollicipes TaxID=41117 RepID=UPI0018857736|nr:glutamate receptor ionotropic, kainate 4-like [Pollicipes pollicipes]